ncbi:MAG: CCA tRNA nucleotidyltransferase [Cuniculiplasma sp.]
MEKYKPTREEVGRRNLLVQRVIYELKAEIRKRELDADPILVGSAARGTSLKNSDVDVFVVFSRKYDRNVLERMGLELGYEIIPDGVAKYAEHPYVSGIIDSVKLDIVPCYKIERGTKIISSVDRTPLHTEFLNSVMTEEERNQAIILKLFLKRLGIYGSELRREGFSGYVTELCIYYFKTFEKFLENVRSSRGQLVIGPKSMDFKTAVILMDPVDEHRNAASSVSVKALSILRMGASEFLSNPSVESIDPEVSISVERHPKDRGTYLLLVEFQKPDMVDDIIFPQIELLKRNLMSFAKEKDFFVLNIHSHVSGENVQILLELESGKLSEVKIHQGPPTDNGNAAHFYEKYKNDPRVARGPYIIKDRIYVELYREETRFREIFLNNLNKINFGHNLNNIKSRLKISESIKRITSSDVYLDFIHTIEPPPLSP